jgi:DNA invertase Pin-like site-specific DNA recombinase
MERIEKLERDLGALKEKVESSDQWKDKYLALLEEVNENFKRKLVKKPPLTAENIAQVKDMYRRGVSFREIGRAVDRTASTIYTVLYNELPEEEFKHHKKVAGRRYEDKRKKEGAGE